MNLRLVTAWALSAFVLLLAETANAACGYSGATYLRSYDWTDDAAAAVPITASRMDEEDDCVAAALSSVVKRNGDSAMTGNLPMGSNQITGLAAATTSTGATNLSQVQIALEGSIAAGGTVDVITATFSPALASLQDKMFVRLIASGANTSATPTFAPNGLTARTIVKGGGQALIAGDIRGAEHVLLLQYDLGNTRWELLNPTFPTGTTAFITTLLNDAAASDARTTIDAQEDVMTTRGDLVTRNASATTRLAVGAANRFLQSDGTDPAWGQVNLGESDVTGTLPIGNVAVFNGLTTDDVLDNDSDFVPYYDAGEAANNKTTLRRLSASGYLESVVMTDDASAAFALDTYPTCAHFRVRMYNILLATDAQVLWFRTATDGTPTFETGASDYAWSQVALAGAVGVSNADAADSEIEIGVSLSNVSGETVAGYIDIFNPSATAPAQITWDVGYQNSASNPSKSNGYGIRLASADVTDIQILTSSGNITSGTFELECVRN